MSTAPPILLADFEYVRALAKERAAIIIEPDRGYLVESRLGPLAEREGFASIAGLVAALRTQRDLGRLHTVVIDALTTNETLFFRDLHPFNALRTEVLPGVIKRLGGQKLNIWSAACSTGQEPYSLAMLIKESFPALGPASVQILGTDFSERVLKQAREACYTQLEINRGLPAPLLIKYFRQQDNRWQVRDEIRALVSFEQMNLIENWPPRPLFDVILLRNVLIYFNAETKKQILAKMARCLHPEGYLIMGSAETPIGLSTELKSCSIGRAVLFRRAL